MASSNVVLFTAALVWTKVLLGVDVCGIQQTTTWLGDGGGARQIASRAQSSKRCVHQTCELTRLVVLWEVANGRSKTYISACIASEHLASAMSMLWLVYFNINHRKSWMVMNGTRTSEAPKRFVMSWSIANIVSSFVFVPGKLLFSPRFILRGGAPMIQRLFLATIS